MKKNILIWMTNKMAKQQEGYRLKEHTWFKGGGESYTREDHDFSGKGRNAK